MPGTATHKRIKSAWARALVALLLCSGSFAGRLAAQPVTAEDFLERAQDHFERRRFLNALDSLRVVLDITAGADARSNATKRTAEIMAARSLAELGRRDEAANMFERAVAHGYAEPVAFAYLGKYFEARGQWQKASDYFREYFAFDKTEVTTHIHYAVVLARLGRRDEARQLLAAIEPAQTGAKIEKCDLFETRKKWQPAAECYLQYRNEHPDREAGYLALYRIASVQRLPAQATEAATILYWLFGDDVRFVWPLIERKLAERRFYDARLLLEEVIRIKGTDSDAEKLLANLRREAPQALKRPYRANSREMKLLGLEEEKIR